MNFIDQKIRFKKVALFILVFASVISFDIHHKPINTQIEQAPFLGTGTYDIGEPDEAGCQEYEVRVLWIRVHRGNTCD